MIAANDGKKLLQQAIRLEFGPELSRDSFVPVSSLHWAREDVIEDCAVRDSILLVPHFSIDRTQDSIELHYRIRWHKVSEILKAAGLPTHFADSAHVDTSIGNLMPDPGWREILVYGDDTPESLGRALGSAWRDVVRPFSIRARRLSLAASTYLSETRLTGPNRDWVRAAALALVGSTQDAEEALARIREQADQGDLDEDVAARLPAFVRLLRERR